jgi:hypothetical protein
VALVGSFIALLREPHEFGRRFAGEAEPLQRQAVARIVDAERDGDELHQRVYGGVATPARRPRAAIGTRP